MTFRKRRVILMSVILTFILATPLVLLYAAGYSFDWQTKEPLLTGAVHLKSTPKKADVYLDGKFKENTSAFIQYLPPERYHLAVKKDGYRSWHKNLKVKPQIVTEANQIFLPSTNPILKNIEADLNKNFSLAEHLKESKTDKIHYIDALDYHLYQTDQEKVYQKKLSSEPLPKGESYEVLTSPDYSQVAALDQKNTLYLFNWEENQFEVLAKNIKDIEFSQDNQKLLYFSEHELWVYYFRKISAQPQKKAQTEEIITRLSQEIIDATWYGKDQYHLVFSTEEKIKFTELDNRYPRNTYNLFNFSAGQIEYNNQEDTLYFVKKDQLFTADLK